MATGAETDIADAVAASVHTRDAFQPDPVVTGMYEELFNEFRAIKTTLAGEWPRLRRARARAAPRIPESGSEPASLPL